MTFVFYKFTIHLKLTCKGLVQTQNQYPLARLHSLNPYLQWKPSCFLLGVVWCSVINTHLGTGKKRISDDGQQGAYFFYKLHISCNMRLCSSQQRRNTPKKRLRANVTENQLVTPTKQLRCLVFPFLWVSYTRTSLFLNSQIYENSVAEGTGVMCFSVRLVHLQVLLGLDPRGRDGTSTSRAVRSLVSLASCGWEFPVLYLDRR